MICACRTESLWLRLIILALAVLLTLAGWVAGNDPWRKPLLPSDFDQAERVGCIDVGSIDFGSDRSVIRQTLRRDALVTVFGTELGPEQFRAFVEALTSQHPAWMAEPEVWQPLREVLAVIVSSGLLPEGESLSTDLVEEKLLAAAAAAHSGPCVYRIDPLVLEVGFATYRHWTTRTVMQPQFDKGDVRWQPTERRVTLPDTHQFYVRLLRPR